MLLDAQVSLLLVVDMQERLIPAVLDSERITGNVTTLMQAAAHMAVPVLLTEHCPDKIGVTVAALCPHGAGAQVVTKQHFSAHAEAAIAQQFAAQERSQIVVAGIEAHVCVLQTTLDLHDAGYHCHLVEDATGSRRSGDKAAAVERMRDRGVQVVTTEMVLFEWLRRGDSEAFKALFPLIRNR